MSHKILDIGNCSFDHGNVQAFLSRHFEVELTQAHGAAQATQLLKEENFDLVLVNRKFDRDGGDGMALIREIKADPHLQSVPVMLLSNYPEYQQQAVAAGALPGFGKAELDAPESIEAMRAALR